ncbi:MAG: helix-turn-helix domain-containing protein [Planctomycetaceae bacterium]
MAIDTATLGAAIKNVRKIRGMTQIELAKASGLSHGGNSIALIEQGKRSVSMTTLNAIARALDIPPACLAVLGSTRIGDSEAATALMKSLQQLISRVLRAEERRPKPAKQQSRRPALTAVGRR